MVEVFLRFSSCEGQGGGAHYALAQADCHPDCSTRGADRCAGQRARLRLGMRPIKVTREQDNLGRRLKTEGEPITSIGRPTGLS